MNSRLSLFAEEQKRKINLGGTSSAVSQAAVIDSARAKRLERFEQKRRHDSAAKIQEWWRGIGQARVVRRELRARFESDVLGIDGIRCLVLLDRDEEALAIWSAAMLANGSKNLFSLAASAHRDSWLILIRKLSLVLLRTVVNAPQSPCVVQHLRVLNLLLSSKSVAKTIDPEFTPKFVQYLTEYLIRNDMFSLISRLIQSIPIEAKSSPVLPHVVDLLRNALFLPADSSISYRTAIIYHVLLHILTIPLLPYRLPLKSLTALSASMPLSDLYLLTSNNIAQLVDSFQIESRIHLLANLVSFFPPRYNQLNKEALAVYLRLLTLLLNSLPLSVLDPSSKEASQNRVQLLQDGDDDDDDDEEKPSRRHVSTATASIAVDTPMLYPTSDTRTLKRIGTLHDHAHISTLLGLAKSHVSLQLDLITFLLALIAAWPAKKNQVLAAAGIYAAGGGGLVRELYRSYVRSSVLGREDSPGSILDPANADAWPSLIFLADLYTQMLLTMGDDEFFGTGLIPANASAGLTRNPLSLDELKVFSRRLLIIAFTLFQREGQADWHRGIVAPNVRFTWENVREKMTKCLVAIHSRHSRKPFAAPDHWLVSSQVDMDSFIDAAIFEEQQLTGETRIGSLYLSKRQIAAMSPRLGILNNIPFAIPFEVRVSIFRHFIINDKLNKGHADRMSSMHRVGRTHIAVRRGSIAQDGFDRLADVDLKLRIEITFIDQFGQEEAGIDGGGVFKEFLTSLSKEVFDTDRGLWLMNKKNELYPNPHAYATEPHSLNWYRFIGRILGKAMYEGILVDVGFAEFFLAKWLGRQSFLDDLASLDSDLYKGLIYLKHYTGNLEDLALNFTIVDQEFGVAKTVELIPDGSNIPVTRENRLQYIQLVSHYRLSRQIKLQSKAFFEGLSELIDPKWLRMFNQHEVQILLGGVNAPIDVEDLRKHTNYGGLYDDNHPTITAFWKVVNSFDQEQRRALLRFVTSCSRPPLLGFRELVPLFAIRDSGADEERLPTASTCVNLLKLPRYQSEKQLHAKLLKAITSGAGFDLS